MYRVQSILIEADNQGRERETILHSFTTAVYPDALSYLMRKHRASGSILYNVMNLDTGELLVSTNENPYRI